MFQLIYHGMFVHNLISPSTLLNDVDLGNYFHRFLFFQKYFCDVDYKEPITYHLEYTLAHISYITL